MAVQRLKPDAASLLKMSGALLAVVAKMEVRRARKREKQDLGLLHDLHPNHFVEFGRETDRTLRAYRDQQRVMVLPEDVCGESQLHVPCMSKS